MTQSVTWWLCAAGTAWHVLAVQLQTFTEWLVRHSLHCCCWRWPPAASCTSADSSVVIQTFVIVAAAASFISTRQRCQPVSRSTRPPHVNFTSTELHNKFNLDRHVALAAVTRPFHVNAIRLCILIFTLVFTALHLMQTRPSDENSVCPSVCPSVCLFAKQVNCD